LTVLVLETILIAAGSSTTRAYIVRCKPALLDARQSEQKVLFFLVGTKMTKIKDRTLSTQVTAGAIPTPAGK